MNNSQQAKKGLKTFLLTLAFSLFLFSAFYFALTTLISGELFGSDSAGAQNSEDSVAYVTTVESEEPKVEDESVFAVISGQVAGVQDTSEDAMKAQSVLAGSTADETTTEVPQTGDVGITLGLFGGFITFVAGMLLIAKGFSINTVKGFEKRILDEL
jgi:hypothetical protein